MLNYLIHCNKITHQFSQLLIRYDVTGISEEGFHFFLKHAIFLHLKQNQNKMLNSYSASHDN